MDENKDLPTYQELIDQLETLEKRIAYLDNFHGDRLLGLADHQHSLNVKFAMRMREFEQRIIELEEHLESLADPFPPQQPIGILDPKPFSKADIRKRVQELMEGLRAIQPG